jgi:hypothetical protein
MYKMVFQIIIISLISCNSREIQQAREYKDYQGNVKNELAAIKIAVINWLPVYGKKIFRAKPFKSRLVGDSVWIVSGSLRHDIEGGVPYAEIKKSNGKVLKITHTK